MKDCYVGTKHQFDIWHVAKNILKKTKGKSKAKIFETLYKISVFGIILTIIP